MKLGGEGARGVFKGGAFACRLKFRKQMILSERSGRIRTRELKEEALRNNWTNRGGRRTAIPKMDHTTGTVKIRKQTVKSDWRGQISTQIIEVETSKNNTLLKSTSEGTEGNTCCWKN